MGGGWGGGGHPSHARSCRRSLTCIRGAVPQAHFFSRVLCVTQARYRKEQASAQPPPWIPPVGNLLKDSTDGSALAALLHFYCPQLLRLSGKQPCSRSGSSRRRSWRLSGDKQRAEVKQVDEERTGSFSTGPVGAGGGSVQGRLEEEWDSLSQQPISTWFLSVGGLLTRLKFNHSQTESHQLIMRTSSTHNDITRGEGPSRLRGSGIILPELLNYQAGDQTPVRAL